MADYREAFVGIDVAKLKNAIAVAEFGRDGEIRYFGEVDASDAGMRRIILRIAAKFDQHFCCLKGRPRTFSTIPANSRPDCPLWLNCRDLFYDAPAL